MRRLWPLGLIAVGALIAILGFWYDVLFAGIPYQDPTTALAASYQFHAMVATILCWSGLGVAALGGVAALARALFRRR